MKQFNIQIPIRGETITKIGAVVQNDLNGNQFILSLMDESEPFDLTGATNMTYTVVKPDGARVIDSVGTNVQITGRESGEVTIIPASATMNVVGECLATLEIYSGESRMTTARFYYIVVPELGEIPDEEIEAKDEFPVLQNLITDVSKLETAVTMAEAGRVESEAERIASEAMREENEATRSAAEEKRITAEQSRDDAEQARILAEQNRAEAEQSRAEAEQSREEAEQERISAERERYAAENQRREIAVAAQKSADDAVSAKAAAKKSAEEAEQSASQAAIEVQNARLQAGIAQAKANDALQWSDLAESYAVGNSTRPGDAEDNAKYYAEVAAERAEKARLSAQAPYIGENGNWYVWDADELFFVDSERKAQGDTGLQGEVGPQGAQGIQGPPGPIGATGQQGEAGPRGPQGIQGPQGPKGDRGSQGESGITAPTNGFFTVGVKENGDLYALVADDASKPPISLDENGNLIYTI